MDPQTGLAIQASFFLYLLWPRSAGTTDFERLHSSFLEHIKISNWPQSWLWSVGFWHIENLKCLANSTKGPRISGRYKVFWSTLAIPISKSTFKILLAVIRCSFIKYSLSHNWNILVIYSLLCRPSLVTNLWHLGTPFFFYNSPFFNILI